jgi:FixJ family two-component response regulator
MRTQHFLESERAVEVQDPKFSARNRCDLRPRELEKRTILLISRDTSLHENLRGLANTVGRIVVRLDGCAGVIPILHAVRPTAVLLDLDLPKQSAWEVAEALLQEQSCPPVLLLTAQSEQFDVRAAIRSGFLIDKSETPSRLLDAVEETLATPGSSQAERNAIQRVLIRWLKPCNWPIPCTPAYHFWGVNE